MKGIITALHGVADSPNITVTSVGGKNGNGRVTVYDVDVPHDLARLSSPAFEHLPAAGLEPAPAVNWQALGRVKVIGYPLGVDLQDLTTPLTVGTPPLKVLGTLVDAPTRLHLQSRHSPDPSQLVLYLIGFLHPGHSGAPILDQNGRVVAVGDGGLQVFSGIGWAILWKGLTWRPAGKEPRLAALRQKASVGLFSFDNDPEAAEKRIIALLQPQLASIKRDTAQLPGMKQDLAHIVTLLENELQVKDRQIDFLQGQITAGVTPSARAQELAAQIPPTADAYALALKAIAEQRFDDARKFLDQAAGEKETELARIYRARGETEHYAGHYADAARWYRKALDLQPDEPSILTSILNGIGAALWAMGDYTEAEPLLRRALAISEKALGPEHPTTALSLNNLATLYFNQGKYAQAEPLLRRALAINEKALGPEHSGTALSLSNLAVLYLDQGKYAAAEPLYQRALTIREKALGPEHPDTAASLNNLALLYQDQGKYAQAEPLFQRALAIFEKALGPEHPTTALSLENYAGLLRKVGRVAEAETMEARAKAIRSKQAEPKPPLLKPPLK